MSTNIVSLSFEGWNIRHVIIDGVPHFVAIDVASVLGYSEPGRAIRQHCRGGVIHTPISDSLGRQQNTRVLTESDVMRLIVSSKLPAAEQFEKWLFETVLPEIRKTGSYGAQAALTDDQIVHQALTILTAKTAELEAKVEVDAPKVAYHERFVAENDDLIKIEIFAAQYGTTAPKIRQMLVARNIASRKHMGQRWSPTDQRMKDEWEWRPRPNRKSHDWFAVLPQHNAPRLHNGQVRQTMYLKQFHAEDLAETLELVGEVA